jgi:Zn-dependent protease
MDRTRLVSAQAGPERGLARRSRALAVPLLTFAASFVAFSVGFGDWRFGLGFVLLILVHELGHVFEARRQGLRVTLPTFIPGFGAYVRHELNLSPWRNALISLAGPLAGGLGAAAVWGVGSARDSHLLVELAYFGFWLNAATLIPVGFLDGGAAWHSIVETWRRPRIRYEDGVPVEASAPERNRAAQLGILYVVLAVALVGCVLATRHSRAF